MWERQTTNKNTGNTTWRCKECHGWDYKGKDGAYGKGSHLTGFPGVYTAGTTKSREQLLDALKGIGSPHDFSKVLDEKSLGDLANLLSQGLIDETKYVDYATKKPIVADPSKGANLYGLCAGCHGLDGKQLNFGSAQSPEFVGTIAGGNPWEFLHKVRFGQPGVAMPSAMVNSWSIQDVMDLLAHAQTLPDK